MNKTEADHLKMAINHIKGFWKESQERGEKECNGQLGTMHFAYSMVGQAYHDSLTVIVYCFRLKIPVSMRLIADDVDLRDYVRQGGEVVESITEEPKGT